MKNHKYTNRNERPVPRYRNGQKVWLKCGSYEEYNVDYTIIRGVSRIRWVDYSDDSPCWDDVPHWEIHYRHQPRQNNKMVQYTIEEESLYDTEAEATKAAFVTFAADTLKRLGRFKQKFRSLGISAVPTLGILENIRKT